MNSPSQELSQDELITLMKQVGAIHHDFPFLEVNSFEIKIDALAKFAQLLLQREGGDKSQEQVVLGENSLKSAFESWESKRESDQYCSFGDGEYRAAMLGFRAALSHEVLKSLGATLSFGVQEAQKPTAPGGDVISIDSDEDAFVIEKMGRLLAEIAIIVKGPEPSLTKWSYHDLPELVRKAASLGGDVVETQWRRVNKLSGWASRWYFLDDDDDIENVRKNFTSSEWEIETRDLVAVNHQARNPNEHRQYY